jgi:hypothetical protein
MTSRDDATKFLETACRNWQCNLRLSDSDIQDVAEALTRFKQQAIAKGVAACAKVADAARENRLHAMSRAKANGKKGEARDFESMAMQASFLRSDIERLSPADIAKGE